ncbi:ABC transporter ATP-binding protein [Ferrimonas sp.]|uniref:ABC transporter ATP-binding protein n=1 Tax=Ferrimonas sp. TaxID=2080861 RepID=UPI003A9140A5
MLAHTTRTTLTGLQEPISPPKAVQLRAAGVSAGYSGTLVIHQVKLELFKGEIACLLGPSGCGKSTLLKAIAGFQPLMAGELWMEQRLLSSTEVQVPPEKRNIGMVFQDIALFPHLTVAQNIAYGLHRRPRTEQRQRVDELLSLIRLEGHGERYPHELSGGQQQRVALARAMAPKPDLLLLDEPFSGLDAHLKEELVPEVRRILTQEGITALLVTHDQQEAFSIADRVAVVHRGQIEQWDTPYALYHKPNTRFVASFVGQGRLIKAQAMANHRVQTALTSSPWNQEHTFAPGTDLEMLIRPTDLRIDEEGELKARITSRQFRGSGSLYEVELASGERVLCTSASMEHQVGQFVGLTLQMKDAALFEALTD